MKKLSIRYVVILFLSIASVTSYTYLSCVAANSASCHSVISSEEEVNEQNTYFPDITLIEKIFETGKRFIPKSS